MKLQWNQEYHKGQCQDPYSFADDCLLYREINNENDENTLQKDLQNLEKWTTNWEMRFNAKKCYMPSLNKKIHGSYKLDGHTLEQAPSSPYLGVHIQEDLKWKEHINNVTKKPVPLWAS